jgi:hypothetical protein
VIAACAAAIVSLTVAVVTVVTSARAERARQRHALAMANMDAETKAGNDRRDLLRTLAAEYAA